VLLALAINLSWTSKSPGTAIFHWIAKNLQVPHWKKSPSALYTSVVNKLVMTPENAINAQELQLNALSAIHERTLLDNGLL